MPIVFGQNLHLLIYGRKACADPEIFVRGGPLLTIFLADDGREDPSATRSGPLSARQRNAINLRFAGVSMMAQH